MFNKKEYRHRRELGLRGQVKLHHTVTPKGEAVPYLKRVRDENTKEDTFVEANYPNDLGHHMVMGRGLVNRRASREKLPHDMENKDRKRVASIQRREAKAAKVRRVQGGEHQRAIKEKEKKHATV